MLVRMRRRDVGSDAASGETARRQRARGAGAASRQAARRQPAARRVPAPLAAARLRVRQLRRRQRARPAVTQLVSVVSLGKVFLRRRVVTFYEVRDDSGSMKLVRPTRSRSHHPLACL